MRFKVNFFFQVNNAGWSETYYNTAATGDDLVPLVLRLGNQRSFLLADNAVFNYVRISDDEVQRDVVPFAIPSPWTIPLVTPRWGDSDQPFTALLVRLSAGALYRRPLFLRGIPDSMTHTVNGWDPTGPYITAFNRFIALLVSDGWALRVQDKDINPFKPVLGINSLVPLQLNVVNHGLVAGDTVRISRTRGIPVANVPYSGVNGLRRVLSVQDANNFTTVAVFPTPQGQYTDGGTVHKIALKLVRITLGQILRLTHRIVGRPFGQPRGRRPATV
jgi:hypothetical protein